MTTRDAVIIAAHKPRETAGADGTRDFTICQECQHMEGGWPSGTYPCPTVHAIARRLEADK